MKKKSKPRVFHLFGWKGEGDAEEIDRFVSGMIRCDGRSIYETAYDQAVELHRSGANESDILSKIVEPQRVSDGSLFENRRWNELDKAENQIRLKAVQDALAGKPRAYEGCRA